MVMHTVLARARGADKPMEMHGLEKRAVSSLKSSYRDVLLDSHAWLPFASEKYRISSDINDYIMVPVVIMPTDLPNTNGVAFPFYELSQFNPDHGVLSYQTWKGKPTHIDHQNSNIEEAKGVVFDSSMVKMPDTAGNLWKVVTLCGFDRSKDGDLARKILSGERTEYSMGAYVSDYRCSICNSSFNSVPQSVRQCEHYHHGHNWFQIYDGVLAYGNTMNPVGFEVSSVDIGAFKSANNLDPYIPELVI